MKEIKAFEDVRIWYDRLTVFFEITHDTMRLYSGISLSEALMLVREILKFARDHRNELMYSHLEIIREIEKLAGEIK